MEAVRSRRSLLKAAGLLVPLAFAPVRAFARPAPRHTALDPVAQLRFFHTHTSEKLDIVYAEHGAYVPDALDRINHLLRDFRSGDVHPIDPRLLDILATVQKRTGSRGQFEIISAYRSPATNAMLRHRSGGVARKSLHLQGQAVDVRLTGLDTRQLRRAALSLAQGGVGYYPDSDFVHLDTGRVRSW